MFFQPGLGVDVMKPKVSDDGSRSNGPKLAMPMATGAGRSRSLIDRQHVSMTQLEDRSRRTIGGSDPKSRRASWSLPRIARRSSKDQRAMPARPPCASLFMIDGVESVIIGVIGRYISLSIGSRTQLRFQQA